MEEKELFEDYELKGWDLSPKFYKILGATAVLHALLIFTVGQFNLLQTKVCDSAYVGKVCQVLDAVYVTSLFMDNKEWTSREYSKDEIADADITYIDVSGDEPPFQYPEGYFAVANPEQTALANPENQITNFGSPAIDFNNSPTMLDPNAPVVLPTPNDRVANQKFPDAPFDFGGSTPRVNRNKTPKQPKQPKVKDESPAALPSLDGAETANSNTAANTNTTAKNEPPKKDENKAEPAKTKSDQEILEFQPNKKPLEDFRDMVKEKVAKKEVDLKAPFSVTVDGVLTKEGKLDPKKTKYTSSTGDEKMIDVAKEGIEALNNSGLFTYLDKLSGKRIVMKLEQNKDGIVATLQSQVENEDKAKSIASGFNFLISIGKKLRDGKDEAVLLESAKVTSQGKIFQMNFQLPPAVAQEMIQRSLTEPEKKTEPNSVAESKNANAKGE